MEQKTVLAVAGGAVSALVFSMALSGSLFGALLGYLSPLALLVVGLGLGSAVMPLAVIAGAGFTTVLHSVTAAAIFCGLHALPSWLVIRQALSRQLVVGPDGRPAPTGPWMPLGSILATLTVFALAGMICMALLIPRDGSLEATVNGAISESLVIVLPTMGEEEVAQTADLISPVFLGTCATLWVVMMAINGSLAQTIVTAKGWNKRPAPRLVTLSLPDWLSWLLVGAAFVGLVASGDVQYVARNVVIVALVPFFFLGLAVVHQLVPKTAGRGALLFAFYAILMLFFAGAATMVALLGLAEQWVGVRHRLRKAHDTKGRE